MEGCRYRRSGFELLGYALNDAGAVVPGLMLGVLVCTRAPLVAVRDTDGRSSRDAGIRRDRDATGNSILGALATADLERESIDARAHHFR